MLKSNGDAFCTGALINNTAEDNRPLFLTAFHCVSSNHSTYVQNALFRFKYKFTTCNASTIATSITYSYADYRAGWRGSDFALLELKERVIDDLTFLGWDRSEDIPLSATGLHHPWRRAMEVSFYDPNLIDTNVETINNFPPHFLWALKLGFGWGLDDGSSGSPLFNQNHLVIGTAACVGAGYNFYSRLSKSWTGDGTNATRLSNWLDPLGIGAVTLNSRRCDNLHISGETINGTRTEEACVVKVENTTLGSNANVTITATEQIVLLPGFNSKAGANGHFSIGKVNSRISTPPNTPYPTSVQSRALGETAEPLYIEKDVVVRDTDNERIRLYQNHPNPSTGQTTIGYYLPPSVHSAWLRIINMNGVTVKSVYLHSMGEGEITLEANSLMPGTYFYSLMIDNKAIDSKRMIIGDK